MEDLKHWIDAEESWSIFPILLHVLLLEKYTWKNGIFHKLRILQVRYLFQFEQPLLCLCTSKLRSVVAGCGQRQAFTVKSSTRARVSVPFTFMHEPLIQCHTHIPNRDGSLVTSFYYVLFILSIVAWWDFTGNYWENIT